MSTDEFWGLVEAARAGGVDCSQQARRLERSLAGMSPEEILGFQRELWQRLADSYRWDLWAVAYIVNGGCSDDGFEYFRGWVISQGRDYFENSLRDPQRAADRAERDCCECEDILYAAFTAYKTKTGQNPSYSGFPSPKEPTGSRWDEEHVQELYPELHERFS